MSVFENLPIALDVANLAPVVTREDVAAKRTDIARALSDLRSGNCPGSDFLGWLEPGGILTSDELANLKDCAESLRSKTDVLLVIGIGGSYLGARAIIEALKPVGTPTHEVVYAGHNVSPHYIRCLRERLKGKRVAINVISKSGTTTEPAIAFRVMKDVAAEDCIVATTDAEKGALLDLAKSEGYKRFVVPRDIGGRFSVLSAVGLLPIAYAGIDIDQLRFGASKCAELCVDPDPLSNPALYYAAVRDILYRRGIAIELFASFEPRLHYLAEWWKQLYGESQGKDGKGLFPASVDFTTDLHSMGQYIQDGRRMLMETFVIAEKGEPSVIIPEQADDSDQLNYLAGKQLDYVNRVAYQATAAAHREGGVPNMTVVLESIDARSLGALIYFFEIACAVSGLMLGVNPFDQPGVVAYKNVMFELLGKPGCGEAGITVTEPDYVTF